MFHTHVSIREPGELGELGVEVEIGEKFTRR